MCYKTRYNDQEKQNAYKNACDCLYYGYGKKYWNDCGIKPEERQEVWQQAFEDVCEEDEW